MADAGVVFFLVVLAAILLVWILFIIIGIIQSMLGEDVSWGTRLFWPLKIVVWIFEGDRYGRRYGRPRRYERHYGYYYGDY